MSLLCITIDYHFFSMIAAIASAIAASASLFLMFKQLELNKVINNKSIELRYYKKLLDKHLINYIPLAFNQLSYIQTGELTGYKKLKKELKSLEKDILILKFYDDDLYEKLKNKIHNIEDNVLFLANRTIIDNDEQVREITLIENEIKLLYSYINEKIYI